MSEEKQLPAEQKPAMQPPMNPMHTGVTKASEKVEMQRVTADVYAMHQRAMQQGRDEQACYDALLSLCRNIEFASTFMYKIPRGGEKVEGIGIDGANEIARVWGHIDSGSVTHGVYAQEAQMEAFAIDLVGPRRRSSRFTVSLVGVKNPGDKQKGEAAKEERNCILDVVPAYVKAGMIKEAKRTLMAAVKDVPKAFHDAVKAFVAYGLTEEMLWQYIGGKRDFARVTEADIVDIRMLYAGAQKDERELDHYFPNRGKSGAAATQAPKPSASRPSAAPEKKTEPSPAGGAEKKSDSPASKEVATEPPKSKNGGNAPTASKGTQKPAAPEKESSGEVAPPAEAANTSDPKPSEPAPAPVDADSSNTQEEPDTASTATSETAESQEEPASSAEQESEPETPSETPAQAAPPKRGVELW